MGQPQRPYEGTGRLLAADKENPRRPPSIIIGPAFALARVPAGELMVSLGTSVGVELNAAHHLGLARRSAARSVPARNSVSPLETSATMKALIDRDFERNAVVYRSAEVPKTVRWGDRDINGYRLQCSEGLAE